MILVTGASRVSSRQLERIEASGHQVAFLQDESGELPVAAAEVEAVLCNSLFAHHPEGQFAHLRLVQATSAGLDRLPVEALTSRGVRVEPARDVYSAAIAEFVLLLILQIYKKSAVLFAQQRRRLWVKQRDLKELTDLTACVVGFGGIGKEVATRLEPFGVRIVSVGRCSTSDQVDHEITTADIVILSAPLTPETFHLMDGRRLSLMKRGSVLINVARGQLVDEVALIRLLDEDHFLGVGLDVFDHEPLACDNQLWNYERVIITPHNSFVSDKSTDRLISLFLKNIVEVL